MPQSGPAPCPATAAPSATMRAGYMIDHMQAIKHSGANPPGNICSGRLGKRRSEGPSGVGRC
jgi:hypothetical protein